MRSKRIYNKCKNTPPNECIPNVYIFLHSHSKLIIYLCIQFSGHENKYFIKMNPYEDFFEGTGQARISTSNVAFVEGSKALRAVANAVGL